MAFKSREILELRSALSIAQAALEELSGERTPVNKPLPPEFVRSIALKALDQMPPKKTPPALPVEKISRRHRQLHARSEAERTGKFDVV